MATPDEIQAGSAVVQAGASIVALVVAGVALRIANQAKAAEKAQADVADEALRAGRRQMAFSAVSFLRVDHPNNEWLPDYPYLAVTYQNGGPTVAYAITVSVMGTVGKGMDDHATRVESGTLPALLQGDSHTTHIPISSLRQDQFTNAFSYDWLTVVCEHRSVLGAHVTATYDYQPAPEPEDESWSLRSVEIDLGEGGERLRLNVD